MVRARTRIARVVLGFVASIAGGSLFGACETQLKEAFVDGSTQLVLGLLDPSMNPCLIPGSDVDADE